MITKRKINAATQENTREHKDFPQGNHKGENPTKLPQYIIQPRQCKSLATRIVAHLPQ